jgi:hypothetical protein
MVKTLFLEFYSIVDLLNRESSRWYTDYETIWIQRSVHIVRSNDLLYSVHTDAPTRKHIMSHTAYAAPDSRERGSYIYRLYLHPCHIAHATMLQQFRCVHTVLRGLVLTVIRVI